MPFGIDDAAELYFGEELIRWIATVGIAGSLASLWHAMSNASKSVSTTTTSTTTTCTQHFDNKKNQLNKIRDNDKRPSQASPVGDGTTGAALDEEVRTGQQVKGKWHYIKAVQLLKNYLDLLNDVENEEKKGDLTKEQADELRDKITEWFSRLYDSVKNARKVPKPPWPKGPLPKGW